MLIRAVFLLALLPAAAWGQGGADHRTLVLAVADGQIIPAVRDFAETAAHLHDRVGQACAGPGAVDPAPLRDGFKAALAAWQKVQPSPFGPVEAFHRGQRIHFWPDKKAMGDRQIGQLLKERAVESLEGSRAALASVAVQGLPALEYLLFAPAQAEALAVDRDFRCRLILAITANLAAMGGEILDDWTRPDGLRAAWADAGGPRSAYADHAQVAAQVFNAFHTQLEAIAEIKLARPLGTGPEDARAIRAESWRSQSSMANIAANLTALRRIAQVGLLPMVPPAAGQRLDKALDDALALTGQPLEPALSDPDGWKRLAALKARTKEVGRVLVAEIGPALGLQLGFNGLDGD